VFGGFLLLLQNPSQDDKLEWRAIKSGWDFLKHSSLTSLGLLFLCLHPPTIFIFITVSDFNLPVVLNSSIFLPLLAAHAYQVPSPHIPRTLTTSILASILVLFQVMTSYSWVVFSKSNLIKGHSVNKILHWFHGFSLFLENPHLHITLRVLPSLGLTVHLPYLERFCPCPFSLWALLTLIPGCLELVMLSFHLEPLHTHFWSSDIGALST
jgi:hypothetical protein